MGSILDKGMDESLVKADVPMPEDLRTEADCLAAVQKDGMALQFVPDALKSVDVCREAVRWNSDAIEFVPDRLKAPELAIPLLSLVSYVCSFHEASPDERQSLPDDFQTEADCVATVRQNVFALQRVPVHLLTQDVVQAALDAISYWFKDDATWERGKELCCP